MLCRVVKTFLEKKDKLNKLPTQVPLKSPLAYKVSGHYKINSKSKVSGNQLSVPCNDLQPHMMS